MTNRIEISYKTILFIFGIIGLFWFLNQIKDILLSLFIAFILMSALKPTVDKLEKLKIPRVLAIIFIYILLLLFFITLGSLILPAIIRESTKLIKILPFYFDQAVQNLSLDSRFSPTQLFPAGGGVIKLTIGIFNNLLSLISLFVFTFYLLLEREHLRTTLDNFFGKELGDRITDVVLKVEKKLGVWVRGQTILCFSIFLMTFIGLSLLKVEYALPLALLAGILEIIPSIGPITSAIPAIIIALATSPFLALATAAVYFLVQQLENHLLVPNVMKKTTGLSVLVIILSLMIGGRLMGFLGILLAVPMVLTIQVIIKEILTAKK